MTTRRNHLAPSPMKKYRQKMAMVRPASWSQIELLSQRFTSYITSNTKQRKLDLLQFLHESFER